MYRIYGSIDNGNPKIIVGGDTIDDAFFQLRKKDINRFGVGAAEDAKSDLIKVPSLTTQNPPADRANSWRGGRCDNDDARC